MITEWTFMSSFDAASLIDAVNEHIQDGWQPFGGITLAYERNIHHELGPQDINLPNDFQHYTQAMVKRDNVGD